MSISLPFEKLQLRTQQASNWLIRYCLPFGWLALLTGMFWIGDRALYTKLFYLTLAAPTLIALLLQPTQLKLILKQPLVILFLLFAGYMIFSITWAGTNENWTSEIKRPLYILMLFSSAALLAIKEQGKIERTIEVSAIFAAIAAGLSLFYYFATNQTGRFSGYGALDNALVASHVYGFFAAYWLNRWYVHKKIAPAIPLAALISLGILILLTGSRTPLMALGACLLWLAIIDIKPKFWLAISAAIGIIYFAQTIASTNSTTLEIGNLLTRGFSYRPQIWLETLQQIKQAPWFGLGFGHPLILSEEVQQQARGNPHNMLLAVLFNGGIIGAILWLSIYSYALIYSWKNRHSPTIKIFSGLLIFGFVSGMTEGSSIMSRPKEHWFQVWIPLALIFGAWITLKINHEPPAEKQYEPTKET